MDLEQKRQAIAAKKAYIDSLPYKPLIPVPYCCRCFQELTEYNIVEKKDGLWDICLTCEDNI